ncbi:tyrosine-protein phosphatase [Bacillus testis]|uniref:tyrosine-protein phosphatase n=1 Tax=Bacillus testis TaxID=1622072 RepID=UPI00067F1ABD|nr:CpsB/CapC family capsule biosynthesis tyrosine phosphatase [Bacillus testis]
MIDIHSHILPGIDDGAQTLEDSLAMARQAVEQGISTIIATPHHRNGKFENDKNSILLKVEELNREIERAGIPIRVLPGQECRIHGEVIDGFHNGEILTMNDNGKYVLIEFSSNHVPMYANQLLCNMQFEGILPIIVHPERNHKLLEQPELVYEMVEKGIFMQVTAASIVGAFGKKIQTFSMQMFEANLVHFIASDAHNVTSRGCKMKDAYKVIEKKFGSEYVSYLKENARLVMEGKPIWSNNPQPIRKKRSFFNLLPF